MENSDLSPVTVLRRYLKSEGFQVMSGAFGHVTIIGVPGQDTIHEFQTGQLYLSVNGHVLVTRDQDVFVLKQGNIFDSNKMRFLCIADKIIQLADPTSIQTIREICNGRNRGNDESS